MKQKPIPVIWRIDVEPDEHQPQNEKKVWNGFVETVNFVDQLRGHLSQNSNHTVNPNWFIRFDPEIKRRFGRADFVYYRHHNLFEQLIKNNDPLGIHIHTQCWDQENKVTYSDFADDSWSLHCLKMSSDVYKNCFGESPRRASYGSYFISEKLLNASIKLGVEVDVTPEPGLPPKIHDPSMGFYVTSPSTDFRDFPRKPYYPSNEAMNKPSSSMENARPILIVPLTSYDYVYAMNSWYRRIAKKILQRPRYHLPLNPWKNWPSPKIYWDLVLQAVEEQPRPYFAFAMRTDGPDSVSFKHVKEIMEYLPEHPISERLQFVDSLGPEIRRLV